MEDNQKPLLEKMSFEFSQEANCLSETNMAEFLQIQCLSDIGIDRNEGCFYILKTDGWSINSVEDLQQLFDRISVVIKT